MGEHKGLGRLSGRVRRFTRGKVPQIGWNQVRRRGSSSILSGVPDGAFAYFVHSFYCEPSDATTVAGVTEYGIEYASVVEHENIWGVQFHPEKSGDDGLQMLRNFVARAAHQG
jgi:glutamine amidotransferase